MSQEEMITASDAGHAGMAARYETLMGEAERKAVRWVWYTDYGLDPCPLHFYLSEFRWPSGRPLRRVPKRVASGRVLYALDDAGHPLVRGNQRHLFAAGPDLLEIVQGGARGEV